MYNKIFTKMYMAIDSMVKDYNINDIEKNYLHYGEAIAYATVLN